MLQSSSCSSSRVAASVLRTLAVAVVLSSSRYDGVVHACTVLIAGRDATTDGSVLVSHSNDGDFTTDPRLVRVPAASRPPGSRRPVHFSPESWPRYVGSDRGTDAYRARDGQRDFVPIGGISTMDGQTRAYLEQTYGALNEAGLGIGESTCSGVFGARPVGAPNGTALFSVDELTRVAMERADTARGAIAIMGALAEEHGFYGAGAFEGTAESLAVADREEAWIFHVLPDPTGRSAVWAAQRVPDDSVAVLANMFVIREVDPNDHDHFMMSDSVHAVAKDYGWWDDKQDGLLDFTKVYSDGEYAHKYYSGRRMWGAYHLMAPSKKFPSEYDDLLTNPVYPVHTVPDNLVSIHDFFRIHRYTYQNTPFDMSKTLAAGPFGSPDRWSGASSEVRGGWERPIGLFRTSDTYVVRTHSDPKRDNVLWFGPASALGTVFTPFSVAATSTTDVPASFRDHHQSEFSRESAFWAACAVHNTANMRWDHAVADVEETQRRLERDSERMVVETERRRARATSSSFETLANVGEHQHHHQHHQHRSSKRLSHHRSATAAVAVEVEREIAAAYEANAAKIVQELWDLADRLLFKYASGYVNEPPRHMSQAVGYPDWWLRAVGYEQGPPPPPTTARCCAPAKKHETDAETDASSSSSTTLTGKEAMKHYRGAEFYAQ